ncbi:MAG: HAD hydrolase-like protein, partial [Erysipelotrichaceae bacterium]|nr:HAD hydrolase-like protein [Erysipelotrichaceae bacterium]
MYYNVSMKYVIFDFNGTVVDDLDLSLACINRTIEKYLDRGPLSKEEYYEVFTSPIKRYYEKAG